MTFRSFLLSCQVRNALRLTRCSANKSSPSNAEQGLTLLECLMAIVIIGITIATITPPIFLATATRIQSRRAEQANQIAQGEVDRIRQLVERSNYTNEQLPANAGSTAARHVSAASALSHALMSPATCNTYPSQSPVLGTALIPVDVDGDCQPEFAMQVYRSSDCLPTVLQRITPTPPPYAFDLGVRVYSYRVGEPLPTLGIDRTSLGLTAGRRDTGTMRRPMQVLYSRIARVNSSEALECSVSHD